MKQEDVTPNELASTVQGDDLKNTLDIVLNRGGNLFITNETQGYTLLHLAADQGADPMLLRTLIQKGLPVNVTDMKGCGTTPLHMAVMNETHAEKMIKVLVEEGADLDAKSSQSPFRWGGLTPKGVAENILKAKTIEEIEKGTVALSDIQALPHIKKIKNIVKQLDNVEKFDALALLPVKAAADAVLGTYWQGEDVETAINNAMETINSNNETYNKHIASLVKLEVMDRLRPTIQAAIKEINANTSWQEKVSKEQAQAKIKAAQETAREKVSQTYPGITFDDTMERLVDTLTLQEYNMTAGKQRSWSCTLF